MLVTCVWRCDRVPNLKTQTVNAIFVRVFRIGLTLSVFFPRNGPTPFPPPPRPSPIFLLLLLLLSWFYFHFLDCVFFFCGGSSDVVFWGRAEANPIVSRGTYSQANAGWIPALSMH